MDDLRPKKTFLQISSPDSDSSCNFTLTPNFKLKKYAQDQELLIFGVFFENLAHCAFILNQILGFFKNSEVSLFKEQQGKGLITGRYRDKNGSFSRAI